nr:hypothetical protein [Tanacetum cinerariifolium]
MEHELYNLRMKGMDIDRYTNRFHELDLLCPRMVEPEAVKVEQYIRGLAKSIHGDVTSSQPATINDAVRLAYQLVGQLIQDKADEATEGEKRKDITTTQIVMANPNPHHLLDYDEEEDSEMEMEEEEPEEEPMSEARMREIIRDQFATSMNEFMANMNSGAGGPGGASGSGGAGGSGGTGGNADGTGVRGTGPTVPELTGYTYATFIKCDPLPFIGTEGAGWISMGTLIDFMSWLCCVQEWWNPRRDYDEVVAAVYRSEKVVLRFKLREMKLGGVVLK